MFSISKLIVIMYLYNGLAAVDYLQCTENELQKCVSTILHLHTNSSVIRLYLPRRRGGIGLLNIKNQCLNQEASLRRKLLTNRDPLITAVAREDAGYTPLSLGCELIPVDLKITKTSGSDGPSLTITSFWENVTAKG
ncbi:hypothetical protein NQ318_005887 [Aromia moschata]|uniref:Uncharacterized protein n=1 Tax=Aromia moschata TaxID=1265417 RepID=A0AAV8YSA0_9CUCU|nr:hypothetical protein NQ318_005887 [Aromia moschata]